MQSLWSWYFAFCTQSDEEEWAGSNDHHAHLCVDAHQIELSRYMVQLKKRCVQPSSMSCRRVLLRCSYLRRVASSNPLISERHHRQDLFHITCGSATLRVRSHGNCVHRNLPRSYHTLSPGGIINGLRCPDTGERLLALRKDVVRNFMLTQQRCASSDDNYRKSKFVLLLADGYLGSTGL